MAETFELRRSGPSSVVERPHIVALPFPLAGHMTPVVQLCKMLIAKAGCRVTFVCSNGVVPVLRKLLPQKHEELNHMKVLPIFDGFPLELVPFTWETIRKVLHPKQEALWRSISPHIQSLSDAVCIISDVYLSWTQEIADQLGVPRLAVWVAAAAEHQVYFHATELVNEGKLPFKAPPGNDKGFDSMIPDCLGKLPAYHRVDDICEGEEKIEIPGLPGLNRRDFPTFLQIEDSADEFFYSFIELVRASLQASMVLFNSFEALEGGLLDVMRSQGLAAHPIGPLFLLEGLVMNDQVEATEIGDVNATKVQNDEKYTECLEWLDGQKPKSVMYVAFGSGIQLAKAQIKELALGLLQSGQPFIWVYPKPREEGERQELPEGLLDQVKAGKGCMLEWVPQKRILNHPSTGAFLTHCGWNSTMESICSGVPTLCLPFVSDQYLHCKMMVDGWKVGLRLERSPYVGVALAHDIARFTQELLVGTKGDPLRKRAQELKLAAETCIQPGGSSRLTLEAIIKLVKK